jgi:hypothetical protein
MAAYLQVQKIIFLIALGILVTTLSYAQRDSEVWKLQLAVGINNPMEKVGNVGYYSKYVNFPTVNIGLQHMFTESLGAKLDVGFNRASNHDTSLEYKLNYTRVNAQIVYNLRSVLSFLPERIALVAHAGPGISFTKPLGNFSDNKYTYLNALGGMELHYGLSKSLSIYTDLGYVYSLAAKNKYDVNVDGFSFNDDLMYVTFGISASLNGCKYCN